MSFLEIINYSKILIERKFEAIASEWNNDSVFHNWRTQIEVFTFLNEFQLLDSSITFINLKSIKDEIDNICITISFFQEKIELDSGLIKYTSKIQKNHFGDIDLGEKIYIVLDISDIYNYEKIISVSDSEELYNKITYEIKFIFELISSKKDSVNDFLTNFKK